MVPHDSVLRLKEYDTAVVPDPKLVAGDVVLPYAVLVPHWNQALVLAPFGSAEPFNRAAVALTLLAELVATVGAGDEQALVVRLRPLP